AIWTSLRDEPTRLIAAVKALEPSVENWYALKHALNHAFAGDGINDDVDLAAAKMAVHAWSFSGLGLKSGSPQGGERQESQYKIDCRWNPAGIERRIMEIHTLLSRFDVSVTRLDFEALLGDTRGATVYLDPPYVEKGGELYADSFDYPTHQRLASAVLGCDANWLLSYDDHVLVRELYAGCAITEVPMTATISGARRKVELAIQR
ncbi:MAG: DNA adenine methylase, partial [Bosea sp. (in: a-proteobacteria)]